ncbi:MAG: PspC domain-containing protein [Candidatus Izimaplasma sp.]|nr:PspC domain-containing protein [Candidatus Izimaplasma bacterium]
MDATKRLYRVNEDKVILGVCSGLSEYFSIDVNIVRIATVVFALFGGFPIIIYLVIGVILPVKEIEIEKAETIENDEYSYDEDDYKF